MAPSKSGTSVPWSSLPGDHPGVSEGDAQALHGGLHQDAVEAEARSPRQVGGRRVVVVREPVRPIACPHQVVEQRPSVQVVRLRRTPARLEQRRAAHRHQRLLEQRLAMRRTLDAVGERDPLVELALLGGERALVGLELDGQVGVGGLEVR